MSYDIVAEATPWVLTMAGVAVLILILVFGVAWAGRNIDRDDS